MIVKLLTEHHLEFLSLKEAAEVLRSLQMSKCHIIGNLMHWLIINIGANGLACILYIVLGQLLNCQYSL